MSRHGQRANNNHINSHHHHHHRTNHHDSSTATGTSAVPPSLSALVPTTTTTTITTTTAVPLSVSTMSSSSSSGGGVAVVMCDEGGAITELNAVASAMFGWSVEQARGQNIAIFMPAPFKQLHHKFITKYLATGESNVIGQTRAFRGEKKDGTQFPIELSLEELSTPVMTSGSSGGSALKRPASTANLPSASTGYAPLMQRRFLAIIRDVSGRPTQLPVPFPSSVRAHRSRYNKDFEELAHVGSGGFGAVFKVRNRVDGQLYAVKMIRLVTVHTEVDAEELTIMFGQQTQSRNTQQRNAPSIAGSGATSASSLTVHALNRHSLSASASPQISPLTSPRSPLRINLDVISANQTAASVSSSSSDSQRPTFASSPRMRRRLTDSGLVYPVFSLSPNLSPRFHSSSPVPLHNSQGHGLPIGSPPSVASAPGGLGSTLSPSLSPQPLFDERILKKLKEASVLANISSHPHVVRYYTSWVEAIPLDTLSPDDPLAGGGESSMTEDGNSGEEEEEEEEQVPRLRTMSWSSKLSRSRSSKQPLRKGDSGSRRNQDDDRSVVVQKNDHDDYDDIHSFELDGGSQPDRTSSNVKIDSSINHHKIPRSARALSFHDNVKSRSRPIPIIINSEDHSQSGHHVIINSTTSGSSTSTSTTNSPARDADGDDEEDNNDATGDFFLEKMQFGSNSLGGYGAGLALAQPVQSSSSQRHHTGSSSEHYKPKVGTSVAGTVSPSMEESSSSAPVEQSCNRATISAESSQSSSSRSSSSTPNRTKAQRRKQSSPGPADVAEDEEEVESGPSASGSLDSPLLNLNRSLSADTGFQFMSADATDGDVDTKVVDSPSSLPSEEEQQGDSSTSHQRLHKRRSVSFQTADEGTTRQDSKLIQWSNHNTNHNSNSTKTAHTDTYGTLITTASHSHVPGSSTSSFSAPQTGPSAAATGKVLVLFIQMQLCESSSLRQLLDDSNRVVDARQNMFLFVQILHGLAHIHVHGYIHRDLKPANIFIENDMVKIGDFGLATSFEMEEEPESHDSVTCRSPSPLSSVSPPGPQAIGHSNNQLSNTANDSAANYHSRGKFGRSNSVSMASGPDAGGHAGSVAKTTGVGTLTYASPEQLSGAYYDTKSDVYSVGIILFELFSVFTTGMERAMAITQLRKGVLPSALDAEYPQECAIIRAMTDLNPAARPNTWDLLCHPLVAPFADSAIHNALAHKSVFESFPVCSPASSVTPAGSAAVSSRGDSGPPSFSPVFQPVFTRSSSSSSQQSQRQLQNGCEATKQHSSFAWPVSPSAAARVASAAPSEYEQFSFPTLSGSPPSISSPSDSPPSMSPPPVQHQLGTSSSEVPTQPVSAPAPAFLSRSNSQESIIITLSAIDRTNSSQTVLATSTTTNGIIETVVPTSLLPTCQGTGVVGTGAVSSCSSCASCSSSVSSSSLSSSSSPLRQNPFVVQVHAPAPSVEQVLLRPFVPATATATATATSCTSMLSSSSASPSSPIRSNVTFSPSSLARVAALVVAAGAIDDNDAIQSSAPLASAISRHTLSTGSSPPLSRITPVVSTTAAPAVAAADDADESIGVDPFAPPSVQLSSSLSSSCPSVVPVAVCEVASIAPAVAPLAFSLAHRPRRASAGSRHLPLPVAQSSGDDPANDDLLDMLMSELRAKDAAIKQLTDTVKRQSATIAMLQAKLTTRGASGTASDASDGLSGTDKQWSQHVRASSFSSTSLTMAATALGATMFAGTGGGRGGGDGVLAAASAAAGAAASSSSVVTPVSDGLASPTAFFPHSRNSGITSVPELAESAMSPRLTSFFTSSSSSSSSFPSSSSVPIISAPLAALSMARTQSVPVLHSMSTDSEVRHGHGRSHRQSQQHHQQQPVGTTLSATLPADGSSPSSSSSPCSTASSSTRLSLNMAGKKLFATIAFKNLLHHRMSS